MANLGRSHHRRWRGVALGGHLQRGCRFCLAGHDGQATTGQIAEWCRIEDVADERLHLRNDSAQRVPVIRITRQCCSMGDKLPADGMLHRGGDAHFDTEFVRPVRFALADALDLWRVQGIDLATALAALLFQHAPGQEQRPYERLPQLFIPDDAPLDVADDTAEIGLELA